MAADAKQNVEAYLDTLRRRLRDMNESEVREIAEELRSHIMDKAAPSGEVTAAAVEAALAALGSPEKLADEYLTDALLARAEVSRSPARILESLFRWASLSLAGFVVLLGSVTGYVLGAAFLLCAVLKPFHPHSAGLWLIPDGAGDVVLSLRMGFEGAPAGGRDLLGWWIMPFGLFVGCGLVTLTTRFALWCARAYRRSHALPRG